jgi:ribosome-associated toxin RatA of RatAB toxin-antitoxin module
MREHRYSVDFPHSPERLWSLMQDYDNWTQYAPMVIKVDVLHAGDDKGNGLLRRVIYKMPLGRKGSALELVTNVRAAEGYTYTMIGAPGNDQTGAVRLERLGPNKTRLHFEERYNIQKPPFKWFEAQIYKFINKQNELSMRRLSQWLTDHPDYRPDLVESTG